MLTRLASLIRRTMCAGTLLFAGTAHAAFFNPLPGLFGNDDGTQVFARVGPAVSLGGLNQLSGMAFTGLIGAGDPSTAIPLLNAADAPNTTVVAFFNYGVIFDQSGNFRGSFTPPPNGLSFFLSIPEVNFFASTEDALNPFSLDLVATFPSLTVPAEYLLEFTVPDPSSPVNIALAFVVVDGVVAATVPVPVPEPITLALLAGGVGLTVVSRLKRRA